MTQSSDSRLTDASTQRRRRAFVAPVLAWVTVLSGLANLYVSLPRILHRGLPAWLPLEVSRGSRLLSATAGIFLLVLARALGRRKRAAWQLALGLFALSALVHPFKGKSEEAAALSLVMVIVLLLAGREFRVKSDPVTRAGGWWVMGLSVVLVYAYTAAGYYLLRRHFAEVTDVGDALLAAAGLLTSFQTGQAFPLNREAAAFAGSACTLEVIGLFAGLFMILVPFIDRRLQESERPLVEPFLRRHGRSGPSYFALEGDTRYYFLKGVAGVVPYTYRAGVALVAGEPLCEETDLARACSEFGEFCVEHDWAPAYYQLGAPARAVLEGLGYGAIKVGEEGFFDLPGYSLKGGERARLRSGVRRAEREGVTVHEHRPGTAGSAALQARMEALSEQWLRMHGGSEMGFLLGGYSFRHPRDRRYFVAEAAGRVVGVMTFIPVYARREVALDMMRRAPDAPPGVMELLLHAALTAFQREGLARLSLALAPLANVAAGEEDARFGGARRVLGVAFDRLNRVYNFRTLYVFKHRLGPDAWEPRYLVFRTARALPAVALALIQVHQPRSLLRRLLHPGEGPDAHLPAAPPAGPGEEVA